MVVGHSGFPVTSWIYLFHMALFFVVSGLFWNDKNAVCFESGKSYILRKLKSLWVPYVLATITYLTLNNTFLFLGIYTSNPDFLLFAGPIDRLTDSITLVTFFKTVPKVLIFHSGTQMGGALWFLRCLFYVNVVHCLISFIIFRFSLNFKTKNIILFIVFVFAVIGMEMVNQGHLLFLRGYRNEFAAYVAFLLGMRLRAILWWLENSFSTKQFCITGIASFVVLCFLNHMGRVSLANAYTTNFLFYFLATISGWFLLYSFVSIAGGYVNNILNGICSHSIAILILHFLSFKIVSYIYLFVTSGNMLQLSCFPTVHQCPNYLWFFYSVIGIIVPCIADMLYERIRSSVRQ